MGKRADNGPWVRTWATCGRALLFVLAALLLASCQGVGPSADAPTTGGVTAHAVWPASGASSAPSSFLGRPFNVANPLPPALATVVMTVSAADISPAISQSFAASDRAGQVDGVPVGAGRTLTLHAYNSGNQLLYQGSVAGITVEPGVVSDAGDVAMQWVYSLPPGTLSITGPGNPFVRKLSSTTLMGTCTSDPANTIQLTGAFSDSFASSAGTFSLPVSLGGSPSEGDHVTTVSQVDDYTGDISQSLSWTWSYDTTPPGGFGLSSPAAPTNNLSSISISGSCEDGAIVSLKDVTGNDAGNASQTCNGSSFLFTFNKGVDNTYLVELRQADVAGNADATVLTVNWTRDTTPPAAPVITSPTASPVVLAGSALTIGGDCEPGAPVTLVDITDSGAANDAQTCDGGGNFSFNVSKSVNGLYTFALTQTDAVGNVSAAAYQQWIRGAPQFFVTPTALSAREDGTAQTFSVAVNTPPTGNVVVDVFSTDLSEATVAPPSLTFDAGNWQLAQTVTVTPKTDDVPDGNQTATVVLTVDTMSTLDGSGYAALDPANVSMTVLDINGIGFTVTPQSGLSVTEAGSQATFSVVLNSAPSDNVAINVVSTDTTEATVDKPLLTFTTGNWSVAQVVTITGAEDALVDGSQTVTIALTINPGGTMDASGYASLNPPDVTVTTIDGDAVSFTVTPVSGLLVSESGNAATFSMVLNTEPSGNVMVNVVSLDSSEVSVNKAALLFTPSDWFTQQVVTVTGLNDDLDDGNQTVTIALTVNSGGTTDGSGYALLNPPDVQVTNSDDDTAGFTVIPASAVTTEQGGTATFNVSLNTQPDPGKVVAINVTSLDTTEVTVDKAQLTFTEMDWGTPQVVTLTGVQDPVPTVDGNQTVTVQLAIDGAAINLDPVYALLNPPDVSVVNTDNNVAGVTVTPTSLTVSESGSSAQFSVRLNTLPTGNVVMLVNNGAASEIGVDRSTLTFTPGDWQTTQYVTVTGLPDGSADGNQVVTVALIMDTSLTSADYDGVDPANVTVTNQDYTAAVTVTPTSGLNTTEPGGTAQFTVVLNRPPAAGKVVAISVASLTPAEVAVDKDSLDFDEFNWATPQTVTLTGLDDSGAPDGNKLVTIELAIAGGTDDPDYGAPVNVPDVSVTNVDDDSVDIIVSPTALATSETGGSATFSVSISQSPQPGLAVVIDLAVSDPLEISVDKTTLTFTPSDWMTAQVVTVTGQNDTATDGDKSETVTLTVNNAATDDNFDNFPIPVVDVTNVDNEPKSEGEDGNPLEVGGNLPYPGANASGESSYYAISSLTPGAQYFVSISSMTSPSTLRVYSTPTFDDPPLCTGTQFSGFTIPKHCPATAAGGVLYVQVVNNAGAYGSTYVLDIRLMPIASEGDDTGGAVDLTAVMPYADGVVGTNGSSYYIIRGYTDGTPFVALDQVLVRVKNLTTDVDLYVYSQPDFTNELCRATVSFVNEACRATVTGTEALYVRVDEIGGDPGSTFTVDAVPVPANEGNALAPVPLTAQSPYDGATVNGSYYEVSGLDPGTTYGVLVTDPTNHVRLEVWADMFLTSPICVSDNLVNQPERCDRAANLSGKLFLFVNDPTAPLGTTYTIRIQ